MFNCQFINYILTDIIKTFFKINENKNPLKILVEICFIFFLTIIIFTFIILLCIYSSN